MFRRLALLSALVLAMPVATAMAADADTIYPGALLQKKPALAKQYAALVKPVLAEHGWAAAGKGTETPVTHVSFDNNDYAVLSSCKPHDCASENIVVLMRPGAKQAVGALVVNSGDDGLGPKRSNITWLGTPGRNQRRFMGAYLFR